MKTNFLLGTDSYKLTHHRQYPKGTQTVYSYLESRGGRFPSTAFFGLQYYLMEYLSGCVFDKHDIEEAKMIAGQHFGDETMFNYKGWMRLLEKHGGYLPLRIKAVPEGSVIPTGNVLMTVENTDPEFPWLTNFVESRLLKVWYPTTVATISYGCRRIINMYAELTGNPELVDFKLHDFGYRGVSSEESAMIGGAAHLLNFLGSDTVPAIQFLRKYYRATETPSFSIPASEHSTTTSWGKENEQAAYENMLDIYPNGLVSVVSDSYDIFNACDKIWGEALRDKVLNRNGTVVIRPDSGDPIPTLLKIFDILEDKFGYTRNEKGFKVLPDQLRVIQGDGINITSLAGILAALKSTERSVDNIAFGMGGGLLQQCDRDTCRFAFKCSSIEINGRWQDVFKTSTDKASKRGRLSLVKVGDGYATIEQGSGLQTSDILETVFLDGETVKIQTLKEIRGRVTSASKY